MARFKNFQQTIVNERKILINLEFYFPITSEEFEILKYECTSCKIHESLLEGKIIEFRFLLDYDKEIIENINLIIESQTYWLLLSRSENWFINLISNFFLKYVENL